MFGPNHSDTLTILTGLAAVLRAKGKMKEAETLLYVAWRGGMPVTVYIANSLLLKCIIYFYLLGLLLLPFFSRVLSRSLPSSNDEEL